MYNAVPMHEEARNDKIILAIKHGGGTEQATENAKCITLHLLFYKYTEIVMSVTLQRREGRGLSSRITFLEGLMPGVAVGVRLDGSS